MGLIVSVIGGVMVGHVFMSVAISNNGFRDYRLWVGFAGFVLAVIGVASA